MRKNLPELLLYALNLAIPAALSVLLIPLLISNSGEAGWASIAVGQALGGPAAVIIGYGWSIQGPAAISGAARSLVAQEFFEALKTRTALTIPILLAASVVAAILSPQPTVAVFGVLSIGIQGIRCNWLFIGLHSPARILLFETLPRGLGLVAAIVVLLSLQDAASIALSMQALGLIVSLVLTSLWVRKRYGPPSGGLRSLRWLLIHQRHGVIGSLISSAYGAYPILIVSAVAPQTVPALALAQRLQAQMATAASPLADFAQSWVPRTPDLHQRRQRTLRAMVTVGAATSLAAAVFVAISAPLIRFLGAGLVGLSLISCALLAALVVIGSVNTVATVAGMPAVGKLRYYARNVTISSILGAALIPLVSLTSSTEAVLGAMVVAALILLTLNTLAIRSPRT